MLFDKTVNKSIHVLRALVISLAVLGSCLSVPQIALAETKYISDELNVPVRSGASNQHRIIKFLSSGTAVKTLSTSDDGKYYEVEIPDGKQGWVLVNNVMDLPSGRDRLVTVNKRLKDARDENVELKATIKELKSEIAQLTNQKNSLETERTNLNNSLEDLKITAANPIALSRKNRQLKDELDNALADVKALETENDGLRNNVMQEWFMIGGAVSIGSLILGIILTRIRWRKRDSWGSDF